MKTLTSGAVQDGRTLIELLIAMTIGMVIVVGVSALYLSSSGLSRTSNQISTVEQAGQLALLMIGDSLKVAAYGEIIGSDFAAQGQTLMDGIHLRGCSNAQFTAPFPAYSDTPTPGTPPPPNLNCTVASGGDALYVRYQAAPAIAQIEPNDFARIALNDCGANPNNQRQVLGSGQMQAGAGMERRIVTNVFQLNSITNTLECAGYGAPAIVPLLQNVMEFKVFYRFDDVAYTLGASGVTNAVPFGGSIREAGGAVVDPQAINFLPAGAINPWNYVVAVIVCITVQTDEGGVSTAPVNATASRCPLTAGEAESGLNLTTLLPTTDGRIRRTFSQVFTVRARATPTPSIL